MSSSFKFYLLWLARGEANVVSLVESVKQNVEQYKAAKTEAKALAASATKSKSTGSYTITFASEKTYSGKGTINRAIESAAYRSMQNDTIPVAIDWTPADSHEDAFVAEYIRIQETGGPISRNIGRKNQPNYNMIQSPGEIIYFKRTGTFYPQKNVSIQE